MLKLIKFEWKKNQIRKYIRNAIILSFILLIFIIGLVSQLDTEASIELYNESIVNVAVELFTHISYIIFTGVMLSTFIINTYENKTIHLMFSYPIKRQKILLSKIFAVWIFNFLALTLSKFFIYAILILTKSYTHISTVGIQINNLFFLLNIILSSAEMISISYIALLIGLKMKSSKATIITSVIISCFTQGNIGEYTLFGNVLFYSVLLILSFVSIFLSIHNVENEDVM